jgi:hypothetical protein
VGTSTIAIFLAAPDSVAVDERERDERLVVTTWRVRLGCCDAADDDDLDLVIRMMTEGAGETATWWQSCRETRCS